MFYRNKLPMISILSILLFVSSCAELKLDPPSQDSPTILVLPVRVTNTTERTSRHGFYYIYEIISDPDEKVSLDTRVIPYEAIIKLPRKGDMLIVDSLPPGRYLVDKIIIKHVGTGTPTYGNNVFSRKDKFKLVAGKITIFPLSLEVSLYNKTPGRGSNTTYAKKLVSVSLDQRYEILTTLKKLPNFDKWEVLDLY